MTDAEYAARATAILRKKGYVSEAGNGIEAAKIIQSIADNVPKDGDTCMGEDGLLHCSRCGGARETRLTIGGKDMTVACICECMQEQLDIEKREQNAMEQVQAVRRYRSMGFPDREMQAWTFANDDGQNKRLMSAMRAYVDHFGDFNKKGKGLFLYGKVGTGKSYAAACVVNALIEQARPCLMTNFARLTNTIGATWDKQEYIDSLTRLDLIAIDDLGVERDTEYMNESVTTIIDGLYRANVPMIITSNQTPAALREDPDMRRLRAFNRLLERCHPIKVEGVDRRKERGGADFCEMNRLLGLEGNK